MLDELRYPHLEVDMPSYVKHFEAQGLHGRFDVELEFFEDVNILYGRNGTGKTTIMHILANLYAGSMGRFAYLSFDRIRIVLSDDKDIVIQRVLDEETGKPAIQISKNGVVIASELVSKLRRFHRAKVSERELRRVWPQSIERAAEMRADLGLGRAAYFPAFRTTIESWSARGDNISRRPGSSLSGAYPMDRDKEFESTYLARSLFGEFVPIVDYPSPLDIEAELGREIRSAAYHISRRTQDALSDAFINVLAALSPTGNDNNLPPDIILEKIRSLLNAQGGVETQGESPSTPTDIYFHLSQAVNSLRTSKFSDAASNVLTVYEQFLRKRIDITNESLAPVSNYIESVGRFLQGKRLAIGSTEGERGDFIAVIVFDDGRKASLQILSSGERQIVSMLYAASHMVASNDVVLIDEPELSLHIDWQRLLLQEMEEQVGKRQIIVSTHSPEIGADYEDKYQEVKPTLVNQGDRIPWHDLEDLDTGADDDFDDVPF
jgi:ABC-type lipoprotein export system ATPase subunit